MWQMRKMWQIGMGVGLRVATAAKDVRMRFGAAKDVVCTGAGRCDFVRYVWTSVGLPVRNVSLLVEARHFRNKSSRKVTMKVRPSGRYLWSQNEWSTGDFANLERKLCCCSCCSSIEELVRCLRSYRGAALPLRSVRRSLRLRRAPCLLLLGLLFL